MMGFKLGCLGMYHIKSVNKIIMEEIIPSTAVRKSFLFLEVSDKISFNNETNVYTFGPNYFSHKNRNNEYFLERGDVNGIDT